MQITDEIFYHIKKDNYKIEEWEVNNEIDWTNRKSNFIETIFGLDLEMPFQGSKMSYRKANDELLKIPLPQRNNHLFEFYNFGNYALNKTSMMLRELILEEYRNEKCQHLPSRLNSIWLCHKDNIDYWIKALQIENYKIYKVKATGNAHIASESNLYSDVMNINQYRAMAEKYWKDNQDISIDTEIIFEGKIKVIERIK